VKVGGSNPSSPNSFELPRGVRGAIGVQAMIRAPLGEASAWQFVEPNADTSSGAFHVLEAVRLYKALSPWLP